MSATTPVIPEHLLALREYLEQFISQAADLAVAESRLETTAAGIETSELWTKGDTPMPGAVIGAIEHAIFQVREDSQPGLLIAQAGQDALDVLDLAITRCDGA